LVVDDNRGVREMLATMLENLGYQVLAVSSSDEALILIDTEDIDGFSLISIWAATPAGSICAVR
jgi:CheY-like chemotaxis protein